MRKGAHLSAVTLEDDPATFTLSQQIAMLAAMVQRQGTAGRANPFYSPERYGISKEELDSRLAGQFCLFCGPPEVHRVSTCARFKRHVAGQERTHGMGRGRGQRPR